MACTNKRYICRLCHKQFRPQHPDDEFGPKCWLKMMQCKDFWAAYSWTRANKKRQAEFVFGKKHD